METITRKDSRYKPSFNPKRIENYIDDPSVTNLIKRVDEICEKYGFEYDSKIYKVIETGITGTMNNSGVRLKSRKTRYRGQDDIQITYYEVKIKKKEVVLL
ncbi:hypothetical protein BC5_0038 [Bacillus phage BC-5]|uniref:Uncharacterized protein n=1 Tax=Bacillus phage BC-5 TaxID=3020389 RepID=A0AAF0BY76_9CAUD|nr:hypothetical protein BC5_0038 [Bacillus phage BC-5]